MELWERLSGKIIRGQDGDPYVTSVLSINAVLPQKPKFRGKILFFKCNFSIIPGKLVRIKEWDVGVVWQEPRRTLIVSPAAVAIKLRARRISLCRIKAALMRLSRVFDPFPILLSIRGKGQSSRLLSLFLIHLFSSFLFLASSILLSLSLCPLSLPLYRAHFTCNARKFPKLYYTPSSISTSLWPDSIVFHDEIPQGARLIPTHTEQVRTETRNPSKGKNFLSMEFYFFPVWRNVHTVVTFFKVSVT